jgi:hypothetical protein
MLQLRTQAASIPLYKLPPISVRLLSKPYPHHPLVSHASSLANQVLFPCSSLRDFKVKITHADSDRDEQIARATRALKGADEQRIRRADMAVVEGRAKELADAIGKVRKSNEESE